MDDATTDRPGFLRSDTAILISLALFEFVIHVVANAAGSYGYFRDELYYIACSDHLDWGYVDQPPFSIGVLWASRHLLGDSLVALRILPALAGSCVVYLAGVTAKELGGNRFAIVLAACAVITAPILLAMSSFYSMNVFDEVFWSAAAFLMVIIVKRGRLGHWLLLGAILGLGLMNKIGVLWLGAGLGLGLLLTEHRRWLLGRGVWLAAAVALVLFLPHIVWQISHAFPTLEFIRNATGQKYVPVSPLNLFLQQIDAMNVFALPIWITGLLSLGFWKGLKPFRLLAILYVAVFLILVANRAGKVEYLSPLFPVLFAAGAVAIERFSQVVRWHWLRPALLILVIAGGCISAPFAITVLPVETFIAYARTLGVAPSTPEKKEIALLPQFYADMFGWEGLVETVAHAYNTLSPLEREKCVVFANNYGEAGAIDFFGPKYHLPKAISGHNNYWIWGPRSASGEVVIRLGGSVEAMRESYREVTQAGFFYDKYCMPYENNMPIYVCRDRRAPLTDVWLELKHFE